MRALVALLLLAGTASAQAPGEVQPGPPQPMQQPSVMDRRWSVAASLGSLGLEPDRDDAGNVSFGMLELAVRFRIRAWIEVGLSGYGGGAMEGQLETGGLYLDGRYRFLAERSWNVFALLSLGVVSVAAEDATEPEKTGRGSIRLGAGVEKRFRAFALQAELRLVGVGENKDFEPMAITPNQEMAKKNLNGGSLTIGGTFYW
jgi:hypothetical protein